MFSFQGDFKRKRDINLGGNRRNNASQSNARSVLNRAHKERQQRELERKRQRAATLIQRYWHGQRDACRWRQQMRRDQLDILSVLSSNGLADIYSALAWFTAYYSYQCPGDVAQMNAVLLRLFSSVHEGTSGNTYELIAKSVASEQSDKTQWTHLFSRLLGSAIKPNIKASPTMTAFSVNELACIRAFQYLGRRAATETGSGSLSCGILHSLIENKGLYVYLAHHIGSSSQQSGIRAGVVGLVTNLPTIESLYGLALVGFVRHILTIPGLPNLIGVEGVTSLNRANIKWGQVAEQSKVEIFQQPPSPSPSDAIGLMGNMAAFILPRLSRSGTPTPLDLSFIGSCAASAKMIPSCDLLSSKHPLKMNLNSHALSWMQRLVSAPMIELLVRISGDHRSSVAKPALSLLLTFIHSWGKSVNRATLDCLSETVDIRTVGWRHILKDQDFVKSFAGDRVKLDTIRSYDLTEFQFLCELLNRQLQVIGDDELFSQGMSLPLDEIKAIAKICRNISFTLLWSQYVPDDMVNLKDTTSALSRQLYERNVRHPFVAEEFWLMPPALLDIASFANKVAEDPMFSGEDNLDLDNEENGSDISDSDSEPDVDIDTENDEVATTTTNTRLSWLTSAYSGMAKEARIKSIDEKITTPRVAVLRNIPFVVSFHDRVRLFHALIKRDRGQLFGDEMFHQPTVANVAVRRGRIFEDGFYSMFPILSGRPARQIPQSTNEDEDISMVDDSGGVTPAPPPPSFARDRDISHLDPLRARTGFRPAFSDLDFMSSAMQPSLDPMEEQEPEYRQQQRYGRRLRHEEAFKGRMQITFIDRYGMPEAGIDGGGVFKEFLTSLVREAFDPATGMFASTPNNHLYPNPESTNASEPHQQQVILDKYKFLGAVIGKALYEAILVDAPFAMFFLGRCLGQLPGFNDLPSLDEELYRGLVKLKNYPVSSSNDSDQTKDNEEAEDEIARVFGLDFTVTTPTKDGTTRTVPLVSRGDTIKVTSQNRLLYLDLIAQHKLVKQTRAQTEAFLSGLHTVIPPAWLSLLFASPLELSRLVGGDGGSAIDVEDWKRNTTYTGAYAGKTADHPTILAFWDVVENRLTEKQRRHLCKFATSCERPPLLGFAELYPGFSISSSSSDENGEHNHRLPSASTCVNLLKLPVYSNRDVLYKKLTTAIDSGTGFDLS